MLKGTANHMIDYEEYFDSIPCDKCNGTGLVEPFDRNELKCYLDKKYARFNCFTNAMWDYNEWKRIGKVSCLSCDGRGTEW